MPLARREAQRLVASPSHAGQREERGVRARHRVRDLPHHRALPSLGAEPREDALVVHQLPNRAVAAGLERDRERRLALERNPLAALRRHHGHERLFEQPEGDSIQSDVGVEFIGVRWS